jgi:hypothetical protein
LPSRGDLTKWQGSPSEQFNRNLSKLQEWDRTELPRINTAIESGQDPGTLLAETTPFLEELHASMPAQLHIWTARALIQAVAFPVSSAEHHFQSRARQIPGVGKSLICRAEEILVAAGGFARKVGRDSAYETWLWNRSNSALGFTLDPSEGVFRNLVLLTYDLEAESTAALRRVCSGEVDPLSFEAAELYSLVAANARQLSAAYRSLTEVGPDGEFRLSQRFFAEVMRQYYVRYPVGGVMYSGTNAAYIAPVISLDYQLGWTVPWYDEVAHQAFLYLTEEDLEVLREDMATPSVISRIYDRLHPFKYVSADPATAERRWVLLAVGKQPLAARQALVAYSDAIVQNRKLTAIHWSLIHAYLIKPAQQRQESRDSEGGIPPEVVSHERGTGGRTHAETRAIMEMRLDKGGASQVSVLLSALAALVAVRSA